ncbi:E3 ubiquitin-protein ligase Hakai-like isoform X2 [Oppia nitens]|uniref:E3 ubiquitin-protein ligase Hakai-like isoform X2 n=1 Tax=Oppia nitens TaxID=1686743 RepID=UPI0023DAB1A2|nr:E3 ubiquitin-protein ligase Hakai-like isoform X2 [Oppia nitens]
MDSDNESQPKGRPTRGRGRGRGRPPGRPKKATKSTKKTNKKTIIESKDIDENSCEDIVKTKVEVKTEEFDFSDDLGSDLPSHSISSFVNPGANPLHGKEELNWKYRVNLIGEKVVNPRIHCCEKCLLPILVYGRMIACKHVFCLNCAKRYENQCPRCGEKVLRVEKSGLGTVFMCQTESCKRTYLSQRDLQAHIQHRHIRRQTNTLNTSNIANVIPVPTSVSKELSLNVTSTSRTAAYNATSFQSPIPVVSSRSNLITVPIQDEPNYVSPPNYGQPTIQWPAMSTTNSFGYRPPSWTPISPYTNPYNRPPYYQQ